MGWFNKKKFTDDGASSASNNDRALVFQDPRTRVNTTSAASVTTNTAVQNSTTIDNNTNTVTFRSTTQTVTHSQQARITEIVTRRTPSQAELEELMAQIKMNKAPPPTLNGVALRSTTSFKPNSEFRRSSTLVKTEQTSVSQKQGRTVTQHVQTQRVALSPSQKPTWPPKPSASTTTSTAGSTSSTYKPYVSPFALKPIDNTYVSPYASKTGSVSSSVFSKPTATVAKPTVTSSPLSKSTYTSSVLSKPKTTSTPSVLSKPTSSSTAFVTKPTLSTPKTTLPTPFISLNTNKGAVPKSPASTASLASSKDAQGIMPKKATPIKKKLKAAEVVIFNNERFDTANEFRTGSSEDVKALEKTFNALKCKVKTITNAKLGEIRDTVRKLEDKNFDDRSALVVVILSHGRRYDSIAAKDGDYNLDDEVVFPILRNRSLIDKPKILFVQACKGSRETGGFKTDAIKPHGNPSEILKCYSTYEGYVSYRHETGTPFIRTLCDTLLAKPNVDIETIMKDVMNLVKVYTRGDQVPSVTSTMTNKYVFGDYV